MNEIISPSCGNVFEDIGLSDAEEMLVKSKLAMSIKDIMEDKGLTQVKAAEIIGMPQPKLSAMLRGQFRGISEAKMMECITRLGRDIQIVVNAHEHQTKMRGRIEVCMAGI
ncbi:MAG: helix-turn-helix domain-containing protein [Deltaproteobacteria bacterium]|jgi:predicted XRE-type DNA-binding protein|nr:helix-turn-helix domain-containing protein [Deltaproteobacteria bacterium]